MEKNNIDKLNELQEKIDIHFNDLELLKHALIHRSYVNEHNESNGNNERIEFLGDAVLELIISDYLYNKYPKRTEGELTSFRAAVVKTESLADTARHYDLGKYIYMSRGEEATGGRTRPYILANTYEALLGAIYLDQGIDLAIKFVEKDIIPKIANIVKNRLDIDSKSKLQELAQEKFKDTPIYELVSFTGPDHQRVFKMQVLVKESIMGTGEGKSKQEAEQMAAAEALANWEDNIKSINKK